MSREITVAAGQLGPNSEKREEIIERMIELVEKAREKGVNVICYTEDSISPFFFTKEINPEWQKEQFFSQLPNNLTKPLFKKAKEYGIALIVPYAEQDRNYFYNSSIVVNESGEILGKYRKNHIPLSIHPTPGKASYEKLYYSPGNLGHPVFNLKTANAKIGVQICYDRRFPEGYRILALKGAEIVFNPTNMATYAEKERESTWGRCLQSRALENKLFVVAPNKSGEEKGRKNIGRSMIISAVNGKIIAQGKNEGDELVYSTIDLDKILEERSKLPLTRDMRPDLYKELFNLYGLSD